MRRLFTLVAMAALVLAKPNPDSYREKEDFQYSRSSSDDGHKAGFYGAQRGNMGGNYERAHNMDTLAQHQMSGLVRQVDGELGAGAKTRTGSVYTAANSRGIYGSGNYDLSNLKGRNFDEGESLGNSESHSSLTSHNSGYRGHSYSGMNSAGFSSSLAQDSSFGGYQSLGHADQRHIDNLHSTDVTQGHGRYENSNQAGYNMKYHTQYGSHGQSEFEQSSSNLHNSNDFGAESQSRYITTPVKIVMRPGGRVAIPIAAPTYAVSQNVQSEDKNTFNTDAEVLNQHTNIKPTSRVKHYESSYSYRKEWEKHHTIPVDGEIAVSTENPFPKNSELYDDAQLLQSSKNQFQNANFQTAEQSNNINSQHRYGSKSATAGSRYRSGYNAQHSQVDLDAQHSQVDLDEQQSQSGSNLQQSIASSDSYANTYGHRAQQSALRADLTNAVENINLKPKSYHSSYSYHKSWERQGDPYVIKPVGPIYDGQASQRLSASSSNSGAYSAHHSHSSQAQHRYLADSDCDDEGHVRVARSYNTGQELEQQNLDQQTQDGWGKLEDLEQQTPSKFEDLEYLGQQQQNKWDNLQDLGQQTQSQWDNLQQLGQESQNQWDNLQQLGQESHNQWDNLQQLGQQTQDKWDKLEDLGQHTQRDLEQKQNENIEDLSQNSQKEDVINNFEQQSGDLEQRQNENIEDLSQHSQKEDVINNFEQQQNGDVLEGNIKPQETNTHLNAWDQILGFEQSNTQDDITQQIQTVHKNEDNKNMHTLEVSNQQNPWYQSQDTNFESKDNKPHQVENVVVNDKPNFFASFGQSRNQNDQNVWNQNKNNNNRNHFWNMDEFKNYVNQGEHDYHSNYFVTSESEKPIQSLWDKIDNIAGEFSVTEDKIDDKSIFSHDYSNYNSHNHNVEQNEHSWSYVPGNSIFELPQLNTEKSDEKKDSEHHNLFDEEIERTSTVKFDEITVPLPKRPKNISISTNTQQKPSADEGRGDIGPEEFEITSTDKSYKNPEEIEMLSLTKENNNMNVEDNIILSNSMKNKSENIMNLLPMKNLTQINQNNPNKLFSNLHSHISSTSPTIQISSTLKSYSRVDSDNQKPTSYLFTDLQKHKLENHTTESEETQEHTQQQILEQQSDDFGQELGNSWSSINNLDLNYLGNHQQNIEQFEVFHQHENSKPNKISKDIETLNLNKEPHVARADDILYTNTMKNTNESKFLITVSEQETIDKNSPQKLFSNLLRQTSTEHPTIEIVSTTKINNINQKPNLDEMKIISSPNIQNHKTQEKNMETVEMPEEIQQQTLEQQFEDLSQQLQGPWYPHDNLQNGYDQQNMEQQFEVFHQQQNLQDQSSLLDFGQSIDSYLPQMPYKQSNLQHQDVEPPHILNNYDQKPQPLVNSRDTTVNTQHIEPEHTATTDLGYDDPKENQNKSKQEHVPTPIETSKVEPGFWKSVGNKLSNAKNKVFSWFKS